MCWIAGVLKFRNNAGITEEVTAHRTQLVASFTSIITMYYRVIMMMLLGNRFASLKNVTLVGGCDGFQLNTPTAIIVVLFALMLFCHWVDYCATFVTARSLTDQKRVSDFVLLYSMAGSRQL